MYWFIFIRYFLFIFLLLLFSFKAYSQLALPSLFPDVKAINPAIISLRQLGHVRVSIQNDIITKKQNVKTINDAPFVFNDFTRINMKNVNFFYGGKGTGLTSELTADFTMGEKKTSITDALKVVSNYSSENSSKYLEYSFATSNKLGFSLLFADYENDMLSAGIVNGKAFNANKKIKNKVTGGRIGRIFGSNMLSLGLHLEINSLSNKSDLPLASSVQKLFALGLGGGGKHAHFELGIEFDPFEKGKSTNGNTMPMKLTVILEKVFGHLAFGYKGSGYRGSLIDMDKLVQSHYIYTEQSKETRLEHTLNFSLSNDKGFMVGLMGMYSNSNEHRNSNIFNSNETHQTNVESYSVATKIGYSW